MTSFRRLKVVSSIEVSLRLWTVDKVNSPSNVIHQDNKMLNEILVRIVHDCGFQTLSAFDGNEALHVMLQYRIDLIFMDVRCRT